MDSGQDPLNYRSHNMLSLSTASILEKNKVATDSAWLMLLDIEYEANHVRLVHNTENIEFQGNTYIAFPFSIADINENSTDLPNVKLSVSNVTKTIQRMAENNKGFTGAKVKVSIINTNVKDIADLEEHFVITGANATAEWMEFTLGTDFSFARRFPLIRIMKDYCPFKFKGVQCGYKGNQTECNKTLSRCRELGNSVRFGGEPTIPQGGLYASNK